MGLLRPRGCRATALSAWLAASALAVAAYAQPPEAPKRVLVLYWYHKDFPINVSLERAFLSALNARPNFAVEYYAEYLESDRFPGVRQEQAFHDYLRQKYAGLPIDVVVASGTGTEQFLLRHRQTLFSNVPLVSLSNLPVATDAAAGPGMTGVLTYTAFRKNLELALELHPQTEQVFIVSGTLDRDKRLEMRAREELRGYDRNVIVTYLTDLQLDALILKMKNLPERSIVLYSWQQLQSGGGRILETGDILAAIAASAQAPVYGMTEGSIGNGIVGGEVFTLEGIAARAAELALRILGGERARDIPVESAPTVRIFDWRQIQRWNIPEDRLPAGSIVRFREPSVWSLYKWYILGAVLFCAFQVALIASLLIERASRRRAELEYQIQQRELTHLSRVVTIGELVGTLAHELRQPLTAIRLNAQAARRQLAMQPPDLAELDDTLEDIIRSDERADGVIRRVREAIRRNDARQQQVLDLNDVVSDSLSLSAAEMAARSVVTTTHLTPDLPAVLGDRIELQQVVLNLMLNACDAMSGLPTDKRALTVRTELAPDGGVQVSVTDEGPGIPADCVDRIFEPFFTLKKQGLGRGHAICRSIITAHQGRIWTAATSAGTAGATFTFRLPALSLPPLPVEGGAMGEEGRSEVRRR